MITTEIIIIALAGFYWGLPWLLARWLKIICRHRASGIVLTFDDGPGAQVTPELLSLLNQYNQKATFFLLGRNVDINPDIVKKIQHDGHEIASHGYDHIHYWKTSPWRAIRDIQKGWQSLDAALDSENKIYPFRPPYGKLTIVVLLFLLVKRVPIRYWSFVSGDTWPQIPNVANRVDQLISEKKSIVLLHDCDRPDPKRNQFVIQFINTLLSRLEKA